MSRLLWPLAVVMALVIGWSTSGVTGKAPAVREIERLTQQVTTLQAKLRVAEEMAAAAGPVAASVATSGRSSGRSSGPQGERSQAAFAQEDRLVQESLARAAAAERARNPQAQGDAAATSSDSKAKPAPPATVQAVLDRFYRYLEATKTSERDRWQKGRELVEEMRGMGDVAGQALMHVLTAGTDTDERRVAARMLGALHVPQSLPLLREIVENEGDVLMRRAAAAGLRQLQTPDSLPVLERLLANPAEDRFIRLSAAQGLASSGRPYGVAGLAQIFEEAAADGRGRDAAFRSLNSLNDDRPLPFMRQVVASQAEPGYRLLAIRYLTARGDKSALPTLQTVMQSPTEQPSVRDAAAQAYRTLGGK
jgi:HEAT repeat protein